MAQLDSDDFAARLSLALNALNLSRSQLSSLVGAHKSLVSRWLSGQVAPASNNLARISAEFAKLRPGFNMTLWTAPRAEFEAALGLSIARPHPQELPAFSAVTRREWLPLVLGTSAIALVFASLLLWRGWDRSAAPPGAIGRIQPAKVEAASVAVMPFVNVGGDPAKEYLGDGISEEVLNDLANTPNILVSSRTSSFSFKGKNADIKEIARKLNVRAVLEGSVRQEGARIRIVA